MTRAWTWFGVDSQHYHVDDYLKPIFEASNPYAVVRAVAPGRLVNTVAYEVTPAESIEDAMVICDDVLRERGGDPGLRVYLHRGIGLCQVHYAGADPWPTHKECVRRVIWSVIRKLASL